MSSPIGGWPPHLPMKFDNWHGICYTVCEWGKPIPIGGGPVHVGPVADDLLHNPNMNHVHMMPCGGDDDIGPNYCEMGHAGMANVNTIGIKIRGDVYMIGLNVVGLFVGLAT